MRGIASRLALPRLALPRLALPRLALLGLAVLPLDGPGSAFAQPSWASAATAPKDNAGFGVPVALLIRERAIGYGMYQARPGNHYKDGESLLFYLEPVGYQYKKEGDQYRFGASVDLRLTNGGKLVFSKDGFLNAAFTSHHQNKEINFTGNLDIKGAPPGEYQLELLLRDTYSDGTTKVTLPFIID